MNIYFLNSGTSDPENPERTWLAAMKLSKLCPGCLRIKPGLSGLDVKLQFPPENIAMNVVAGVPIGIAKSKFLEELCAMDGAKLKLGDVVAPNDNVITGYVTFYSESVVSFRGDKRSTCVACTVCGRSLYWPAGKRYVLQNEVGEGDVWYNSFCTLLVSQTVMQSVDLTRWKGIRAEKVSVREDPADSFGELVI